MHRRQQVVAAGEQPVRQRHRAAEDARRGARRRRLALGHREDDAAALGRIGDAVQVAVNYAGEQPARVVGVAAQQADAAFGRAGVGGGEEVRELLPRPVRAVVVGGVQHRRRCRALVSASWMNSGKLSPSAAS